MWKQSLLQVLGEVQQQQAEKRREDEEVKSENKRKSSLRRRKDNQAKWEDGFLPSSLITSSTATTLSEALINLYNEQRKQLEKSTKLINDMKTLVHGLHVFYYTTLLQCENYQFANIDNNQQNQMIEEKDIVFPENDKVEVVFAFISDSYESQISRKNVNLFRKRLLDPNFTVTNENRRLLISFLERIYDEITELEYRLTMEQQSASWDHYITSCFIGPDRHPLEKPQINRDYNAYRESVLNEVAKTARGTTTTRTYREVLHREQSFLRGILIPLKQEPDDQKSKSKPRYNFSDTISYQFKYQILLHNHFNQLKKAPPIASNDIDESMKNFSSDMQQNEDQEETPVEEKSLSDIFNEYWDTVDNQMMSSTNLSDQPLMSRVARNQLTAVTRRLKHILSSPYVPNDKKQEAIANFNRLTLHLI